MLGLVAVFLALPEDDTPDVIEIPVYVTGTPSPVGDDTPDVRATASLAVRVGPGEAFATLGTITRGDRLEVVGRDFNSKWLAIRFPLGSNSRGWVPADSVEGLNGASVSTLAVLLPTPLPFVFNTPSPFFGGIGGTGGGTGGAATTPTPIPTTSDLDIQTVRVGPDGRISVSVINRGPAHIVDQVVLLTVRGFGLGGETLTHAGNFPSGQTITFRTETYRLTQPTTIQVIVDPSSSIPDPNRSNNLETVELVPILEVAPSPTVDPSG
jgi:hypothetical protein